MRILILNHEYPPMEGGAANASHAIAKALVVLGHGVRVVTAGEPSWPADEIKDGVRISRVPMAGCGGGAASPVRLLKFARTAADLASRAVSETKFDIVHAFFALPSGWVARGLHRKRSLPFIVSLRGSDVPGFRHPPSHPAWRVAMPFLRRVLDEADAVSANSPALRDLARACWPGEVGVIPNGVDASRFLAPRNSAPRDERVILMVNQLIPRKNVHVMIEALPSLAKAGGGALRLRIVGRGKSGDELAGLVARLGLERQVDFVPHVPPSEIAGEYAKADVFALLSSREGMSNALLEAMASGLACVATREADAGGLIAHGENGLVVSADRNGAGWDSFAELLRDDAMRSRLGAAARKMVAEKFSWDAVAAQFVALYSVAMR